MKPVRIFISVGKCNIYEFHGSGANETAGWIQTWYRSFDRHLYWFLDLNNVSKLKKGLCILIISTRVMYKGPEIASCNYCISSILCSTIWKEWLHSETKVSKTLMSNSCRPTLPQSCRRDRFFLLQIANWKALILKYLHFVARLEIVTNFTSSLVVHRWFVRALFVFLHGHNETSALRHTTQGSSYIIYFLQTRVKFWLRHLIGSISFQE